MMPSSSPPPPTLPITTKPNATSSASSAGDHSSAVPAAAVRQFISHITESARHSLSNRRPWPELVDRNAFSRPDSLSDATSRVRKNVSYFKVNYVAIIVSVVALSLLSSPFSLLVLLSLFAAWCFLYLFRAADSPVVLFGRQFSDRETLGGLFLLTIFVVFLTSVGSILMSSLTVGAAIVGAHGAFRQPEDLFLEEQDGAGGPAAGLLSFLGGGAPSGTVIGVPAVAPAHV